MATIQKHHNSAYFQPIHTFSSDKSTLQVKDPIWGTHSISSPIILSLLSSRAFSRLYKVSQYGTLPSISTHSDELEFPFVSRADHSIGAMLVCRILGASEEEQISALLHDISHTIFSHVIDSVFSGPESFHEAHKDRYVETTDIPQILQQHGFEWSRVGNESIFPLLEQPSPALCADRLDYALRDALAYSYLSKSQVESIVSSLAVFPSLESPSRRICLLSIEAGLLLSTAYMQLDSKVYASPLGMGFYKLCAKIIRLALDNKLVSESDLWMTDADFWDKLKKSATMHQNADGEKFSSLLRLIEYIESPHHYFTLVTTRSNELQVEQIPEPIENETCYTFTVKARSIDPDILIGDNADSTLVKLSQLNSEYGDAISKYKKEKKSAIYTVKLTRESTSPVEPYYLEKSTN